MLELLVVDLARHLAIGQRLVLGTRLKPLGAPTSWLLG